MTKTKLARRIVLALVLIGIGVIGIIYVRAVFSGTTLDLVSDDVDTLEVFDTTFSPDKTIPLTIHGTTFRVALAKTELEQARGLMNKSKMDKSHGMLFIYEDEAQRTFWMKDTFIPLDIIFIDKDKKVVSISANTKPNQTEELYYSNGKSMYVLELNAGRAEELGIKPGNRITF
jgi:uncharacterized membrane protein (UPF0127 family)